MSLICQGHKGVKGEVGEPGKQGHVVRILSELFLSFYLCFISGLDQIDKHNLVRGTELRCRNAGVSRALGSIFCGSLGKENVVCVWYAHKNNLYKQTTSVHKENHALSPITIHKCMPLLCCIFWPQSLHAI